MRITLLFLLVVPLWGQMLPSCPTSGVQGSVVDCSINGAGGSPAVAQVVLTLPASIALPTVTLGTAASAAQKQVACNAVGLCLVYGINTLSIAPGEWLHFKFTIPSALTGNISACLSAPVEGDSAGNGIITTVGPCAAVSISLSVSLCDINGDGRIDATDVAIAQQRILAIPQVPMDLNKDGATNILDLEIVNYAAQGFGCRAQ